MQTIKTAVVVVLLLGVCYGAYVALNAPEPTLPPELAEWSENEMGVSVETGPAVDVPQLPASPPPADLAPLVPPPASPPAPKISVPPPPPSLAIDSPSLPDLSLDIDPKKEESLGSKLNPQGNSSPELPDGTSVPLPGATTPIPGGLPGNGLADGSGLSLPPMPSGDLPLAQNGQPALPPPLAPSAAAATEPKSSKTALPYATVREQALAMTKEGKLKAALELLSPYFDYIALEESEHKDLRLMLDALAAEVIYSKRHLIESRFIVSPGETLEGIANKFRISPETLVSINQLDSSKSILTGTELKVFNGPFRAEVDLSRGELVMYLGDLYAGIFPVTIGSAPKPELGSFTVVEKLRTKGYRTADSQYFEPSHPKNPYGGYWIHLGKDICIHGTAEVLDPALKDEGCISLAPLDVREVYSLLGQGSDVVIKE